MESEPQKQSPLTELESPKEAPRGKWEIVFLSLTILFAIPSALLIFDLGTRWYEVGLRVENVLIIVIEIILGISFGIKDLRERILNKLGLQITLNACQKMLVSILLFAFVIFLTIIVLPTVSGQLSRAGEQDVDNGYLANGKDILNLSLELNPGFILSSVLLAFNINPHYHGAILAHYALGKAFEFDNDEKAAEQYEISKALNECFLYNYWRLAQLQIQLPKPDYELAQTYLNEGIRLLKDNTSHCQPDINPNKEELTFWLYLTQARAYIKEGLFDKAIENLKMVNSILPAYAALPENKAIMSYQYVTYYYWLIKASVDKDPEHPKDCSTIIKVWPIMQQHYKDISVQDLEEITKDRYDESAEIQTKC